MKQVISTSNGVKIMDVPSPIVRNGHLLVEVAYSFVSTGTELATLASMESRGAGVVSDVVSNPALIGKVLSRVRTDGIRKAIAGVSAHLGARRQAADRLEAMGYSCAGRVAAVGEGVSLLKVGDRVACAGAGKATHSEIVLVPENLTSMVPDGCDMRDAASVAIGAIAMQGTRRVAAQLGERVVVLGLGLVGLMAAQLLTLSGARVFGFDVDPEMVKRARALGIDEASSNGEMAVEAVGRLTGHMGADATLITASSKGSEVVQMAMELTRKRGRVVVLGSIGMDIQRDPFLRKEINLLASSSYGPGRYEDRYEEKGLDYPYTYVRWTEKRNMEEYLRLLAGGRIRVGELAEEYPLEAAPAAFDRLGSSADRPVSVVLKHRAEVALDKKTGTRTEVGPPKIAGKPRLAVVGAGKFAQRVHLPSVKRLGGKVELAAIVTRTGVGSVDLARRSGAQYASTSYDEILKDSSIDAVLVATRHDLHAPMALGALAAGKHVFVEKPLAMDEKELGQIQSFYDGDHPDARIPILQTGFNRRFSPIARRLKNALQGRLTPLVMVYQVNALYLPDTHWLRTEEGWGTKPRRGLPFLRPVHVSDR